MTTALASLLLVLLIGGVLGVLLLALLIVGLDL